MAPEARILVVGDELLLGRTDDTNSGRIQRALRARGVATGGVEVVPDRREAIAAALDRTEPGQLVLVSGGLGSTPDDLTRDAVAAWAGVGLAEDPALRARLDERWRRRGVRPRPEVARQAQVPAGLEPVDNPVGSAPALLGRLRDRTLVLLPGVPAELAGLLPPVLARLQAHGLAAAPRPAVVRRTAQLAELALVERCAAVRAEHADLDWSWWLTPWGADVRVAGADAGALEPVGAALDARLAGVVFSAREDESLPAAVQRRLLACRRTVAVAESCTGGLVGARLTDPPGSSGCFRGGVLAYADDVKHELLGVPTDMLATAGAVSETVVRAMAAGARARVGSDYAVAVSGVSGPDGGSTDKPVGTTWIAVATPAAVFAHRYRFPADREGNRRLAVAAALDTLRRVLDADDETPPWRDDDTWGRDR